MPSGKIALALAGVLIGGCAGRTQGVGSPSAIDAKLAQLEQEEQVRRQRLDQIELQIAAAQRELTEARAEVEVQQCRVRVSRIQAQMAAMRSDCVQRQARFEACQAGNEAGIARGAAGGCVVGLLAAFLTGGAAAPWALGGCAAGYAAGEATRRDCGSAVKCTPEQFNAIAQDILRKHKLTDVPTCGAVQASEPMAESRGSVPVEAARVPGRGSGVPAPTFRRRPNR